METKTCTKPITTSFTVEQEVPFTSLPKTNDSLNYLFLFLIVKPCLDVGENHVQYLVLFSFPRKLGDIWDFHFLLCLFLADSTNCPLWFAQKGVCPPKCGKSSVIFWRLMGPCMVQKCKKKWILVKPNVSPSLPKAENWVTENEPILKLFLLF